MDLEQVQRLLVILNEGLVAMQERKVPSLSLSRSLALPHYEVQLFGAILHLPASSTGYSYWMRWWVLHSWNVQLINAPI